MTTPSKFMSPSHKRASTNDFKSSTSYKKRQSST